MSRAITPAGPPGAKPTTIRIGLPGNDCADALPPSPKAAASSAHTNIPLLTTVLLPAGRDRALELEHDLFRKPVSTFRDHALPVISPAPAEYRPDIGGCRPGAWPTIPRLPP